MTIKSFFGLFGGKGQGDPGRDPAPNPAEKRKESRLDVDETPPPTVELYLSSGDEARPIETRVVNVSTRGLRLQMDPKTRGGLSVGQELNGVLRLETFEIPLSLRLVRFIGADGAGFRIRPPFPKELERLERYLEPRFLGRSLREIDPGKLQREPNDSRVMRWFQGLNETNLFSWQDAGGAIVQQQLVFLERVIEWRGGDRPKTGRIRGEGPGLAGWVKAELLEFDAAPDQGAISQARILIDNSGIDPKVKETFLGKISS